MEERVGEREQGSGQQREREGGEKALVLRFVGPC